MPRPSAKPADPAVSSPWRYVVPLALVWLLLFAVYYFTRPIPNGGGANRLTLALLFPELSAFFAGSELPSGIRYLPQRFDLIATAALIAAGVWGLGGLLLRATGRLGSGGVVERVAFQCGLGLSAWSLCTLAFGLLGWLSRPLFAGVLIAALATESMLSLRRRGTRGAATQESGRGPRTGFVALCLAATGLFVALAGLASMLPPYDFDVKEYHLGGPKEWFLDGRVHFLPHNVYTSFPALTETLSLSAMVVRGDWYRGALAGQLVLAGFLPLTAAAVFAAGRRLFGTAAGLLASVIYVATPWAYRISVVAYTEGGLTCYLALALLAAVAIASRLRAGEPAKPSILLTGFFAGSAMACKYPGVVQVVIPIGVALLWMTRREVRPLARTATLYAAGVLLAVGPWLVKNAAETRNPVYPLLWTVFGGADWDAERNAKWRTAHSPSDFAFASLVRSALEIAAENTFQSLLVFGLAPLALLTRKGGAGVPWLYVLYLFGAWWLLTHRIDRFWVPLLPVGCLLAGAGAAWAEDLPRRISDAELGERLRALWRLGCGAFVTVGVLFNLGLITSPLAGKPDYLADLEAAARAYESPNLAILNRTLPQGSRVLLVGEAEIFDARFPLIYNTVFDRNIFEAWTAERRAGVAPEKWPLRSDDEIHRTFARHGVTHVCVNWREILRYRTTYGFTPFVTPARFDELRGAGVLGEPTPLSVVPAEALPSEVLREAEGELPSLLRGYGSERSLMAAELYPVLR